MSDLLTTKLYIPRRRPSIVPRPRLTERLQAGAEQKLTLVSAPAGFGKTTLLSEWIPHSEHCVTWTSLDEGDNDPSRFWGAFIAALQTLHPDIGRNAQSVLQSPQSPPIESILPTLLNEITAFPDIFTHVLDDYHTIEAQPVHEALAFLIEHMPPNMHLVIATRSDPPLPLARLRALDLSGSANVTLWAQESLDVRMSGSGSVSYYGSPRITTDVSGSGSLNSLGDK